MTRVVIPPIGDLPVLLAGGLPGLLTGTGFDMLEAKPNYLRLKQDAALIGLTIRVSDAIGIEERRGYVRTFSSPTHAAVLHRKHAGTNVWRLRGGAPCCSCTRRMRDSPGCTASPIRLD